MYAAFYNSYWSFSSHFTDVRDEERQQLQKAAFLQSFSNTITPSITILASIATFLGYRWDFPMRIDTIHDQRTGIKLILFSQPDREWSLYSRSFHCVCCIHCYAVHSWNFTLWNKMPCWGQSFMQQNSSWCLNIVNTSSFIVYGFCCTTFTSIFIIFFHIYLEIFTTP